MSVPEDQVPGPFDPIVTGRVNSRLQGIKRRALELDAPGGFEQAFGDLLGTPQTAPPEPDNGVSAGDYGRAFESGAAGVGASLAGGVEYLANQFTEPGQENPVAGYFGNRRRALQGTARGVFEQLSPEAQNRAAREILTLDPNKTLFQGGVGDFLSSIGLKVAESAPSTLLTLLPASLFFRAGLSATAIKFLGASEGALSLGSIASNIAEEIERAPESELQGSQYYRQLREQGKDDQFARQQLIRVSQGAAPIVGGLIVGAISSAAGRYLTPLFEGGASLGSRIAGGAGSEAAQEFGQSGAEQIAQNVAAQTYDGKRSALEGSAEAALQGAMLGGVMGGGFGAVAGRGPEARSAPNPQPTASAPAAESFEDVFGENSFVGPSKYRGADIENPEPGATDSRGQGLLDLGSGPVNTELQAALNARREGLIKDLFEDAPPDARAEQRSYLERPFPVTQQGLDLGEPIGTEVAIPPGGQQLALGLRERQRGGPGPVITPTPTQGPQVDEPVPGQISTERADPLTQGNVRDEGQFDLFGQSPAEPDAPSAEPLADLQAQLEDLADPDNERQAVLLSAANIEQLRADGTFEQVRGVGTPIANFDGQGGTLIAKNNAVARELLEQRDQGAGNIQEILGVATGSGTGKPIGGEIVVQQRDAGGNVTRETLVGTPEEAQAKRAQFDEPGRQGVVLSAVEAIRRRNQRLRAESRSAGAARDVRSTRRTAERAIEAELGESDLADKAKRKIGRAPLSENEAARKLANYAGRLRGRELRGRIGDVDRPDNLSFRTPEATEQYKKLFGEYRDANISLELSRTASENLKARARVEALRRQIGAVRRINKATTAAERVARVARKISREEVEKVEQEARENPNPRRRTRDGEGDILSGATRSLLEKSTEEQLVNFSNDEINLLFVEAANFQSGSAARTSSVGDTLPGEGRNNLFVSKRRVLEASGASFDELVAKNPARSQKIKLILRVKRRLLRAKAGGKTKTRPVTATATGRKTALGERVAVRWGKFDPNKAMDLNPPREMSAKDRIEYDARVSRTREASETATAKLITIDNSALGFGLDVQRDAKGNPTEPARDAIYGRAYLKNLIRYGQLLKQLDPRSRSGLSEVERYTKIAESIAATPAPKLAAKLAQLTEAEIGEQARAAARVDPVELGGLTSRKSAVAQAIKRNDTVRQRVAAAQRLHDVFQANPKYEQFVAPLIQKLAGYVTTGGQLGTLPVERRGLGYKPTFNEIKNLRYALREFKQTSNDELYQPLKRWFREYGFKFDREGDLILAKNAADFQYSNEVQLLRQARDPAAFRNAPLNFNQKVAGVKRAKRDALIAKERARRGELTQAQRNREDRTLADRMERDRRKGMSYEQRRALESLDSRSSEYQMSADSIVADKPAVYAASQGLIELLQRSGGLTPARVSDAVQVIGSNLAHDHPYQSILQRLANVGLKDVAVRLGQVKPGSLGTFQTVSAVLPDGKKVTDRVIVLRSEMSKSIQFPQFAAPTIHTFIHEAVHAATSGAIYNNPAIRNGILDLIDRVRAQATVQGVSLNDSEGNEFYGIQGNDPFEFVAEAFSNNEFQERLQQITLERVESAWQKFFRVLQRILGLSDSPSSYSALSLIMTNTDILFTGETEGRAVSGRLPGTSERQLIGSITSSISGAAETTKQLGKRAKNILERAREGGTRAVLSATTMEQIRDFYAKDFGGSGGPLSEYMKTFFRRNADNSANRELPDKLSRRWTRLGEQDSPAAAELSRIMTEATLYGTAPDQALSGPLNQGVTSSEQRARQRELAKRYEALPAEFKKLYQEVQTYYNDSLARETALMAVNALRGVLGGKGFNYTEADVKTKQLDTVEGLEREFGGRLSEEERALIANLAALPKLRKGPYFPLLRVGDYVVTAERIKETRTFIDQKAAKKFVAETEASDPTLSVSFPTKTAGGFQVTVKEKDVRFSETISDAEQNRQDLVATYGQANTDQQVQKKSQLFKADAAISSNTGLRTILGKLDGNPAAQAAIKDFYLRSLGDRSFRKREILRANRRGVDPSIQQRTFRNYARSSAYYTSQLRYGWKLAEELARMDTFARQVASGEEQSESSAVRLAEVVHELNTRDKMSTDPFTVSKVLQKANELTQFMFLASPSYAMVNATQPYMVTLPWLSARSSVAEATTALLSAQRMIASPLVNQAVSSAGGLRALWSRSASERAFSVLEQIEEHIKQSGGPRAQEYINMLNSLKRSDIIDFTMITELRDVAQGQRDTVGQRVLDASRIMGHLTEVNNRVMTAVAAYDLRRNKGATILQAEEFAKQAVSTTQFNYASANSPRLFNARGPLGRMGPLVFQFMKYPQHIYAMLIDNFRRAVWSGGMERKIAIKTLAGVFATHLAAAGTVGAMLQPVKWAIGLALAAFGDDDEPYTLKNALSGDTFDRMMRKAAAQMFGNEIGEIVSQGLPRAAGIDLSNRLSLGSLYFVDLNTDTAESTFGSLVTSFGGPLVNVGGSMIRGAKMMREGQLEKGLESFLPKGAKDVLQTIRFSQEGLTDASGKEIVGADKLSSWELFAKSIGFQPGQISEAYGRRSAIKDAQKYDDDRRKVLLQRVQRAKSPEERSSILDEIREFNLANPAATISRSQVLKSVQGFRERSRKSLSTAGLELQGDDILYAQEGEPYEDGDDGT